MAGSLGEANTSRDNGFKDLVAEEVPQVGSYLAGQVGAIIKHRQEDAFDLKSVAKGISDAFDRVHEFRYAFKGEEFALDRDKDSVGGDEGIKGEQIECRGAIDDYKVILGTRGLDLFPEAEFAAWRIDELQVGANEVLIPWNEI